MIKYDFSMTNNSFLCSCLSDSVNSEEINLAQVKHTAAASTPSIHRLYLTIAKWIWLSTVSECICGYQPTKMALVTSTINTIGNTKSQQGKQYSRLGIDLVLVQNKRNHPSSGGSLILRLSVHSEASAIWMWSNTVQISQEK